jgi:LysR family glycine cleavage system transcriptional activator
MPPLNWLRSFEACARLGSFTAAAVELNITQPAVSHQIRQLEAHLKLALFRRVGRTKQLTDEGRNYLFFVHEAFELLRAGSRKAVDPDRGKSLTLRANMALTLFWLMPRLDSLYRQYPWIRLNILPHISDIEERVPNFEIEIVNLISKARADLRPLRDEYFFPVCSPELAQSGRLDHVPLFDTSSMTASWDEWHGSKYRGPPPKPVNLASTVVVSLTAAINGLGLALAHTSLFEAASKAGQLVRPYDGQIKMKERYFISEVRANEQTPASRAFMEWLEEQLDS